MTIIELIQKYRLEYDNLYSDKSIFNLQPTLKLDVFGRPIQEIGSLDQLQESEQREDAVNEKETWVFKKVWEEIGIEYFQELVAIMGNPGRLNPCDGSWHQCSLFCDKLSNCPYGEKIPKKESKVEEVAVPRSTESKKRSKKKRRKK